MSCLEYKVITYHQSKLIIVDWVGVVNDYRGGRSKAVSHTASSQYGLRERGGSAHLFGIHWETTASQGGQKSQKLNKEMKRNLRKMDESRGQHPPLSPCIADDKHCSFMCECVCVCVREREKEREREEGHRDCARERETERDCVYVSVCDK